MPKVRVERIIMEASFLKEEKLDVSCKYSARDREETI